MVPLRVRDDVRSWSNYSSEFLFSFFSFSFALKRSGKRSVRELQACEKETFSLLFWESIAAQFSENTVHSIIQVASAPFLSC